MDDASEIIKWLKHIGEDFCDDDPTVKCHAECDGSEDCPEHEDCGICRWEYLQKLMEGNDG